MLGSRGVECLPSVRGALSGGAQLHPVADFLRVIPHVLADLEPPWPSAIASPLGKRLFWKLEE